MPGNKQLVAKNGVKPGLKDPMQLETLDFNKKILHASWHPRENTIAVCVVVLGYLFCSRADDVGVTDRCDKQSVPVQCRMKDHSIHSPLPLLGSQVMEPSCPLHSFWTIPLVPLLSSPTSPLHPPHCYYPQSLPHVCCTLLLLSVPPVSNQRCPVVLSCVAMARHTRNLARTDGWGTKGGELDGERGESRVNSIQRLLYSGAALRSNAIKGVCIITPLPVHGS